MAITNGYTTLATLKARLGIGDTTDDAVLEAIVESVSRAIDDWTGRRFYAATQTRYYTARRADRLLIDDLLSVTEISTDANADGDFEYTWEASDYLLAPFNAQLESVPQPYTTVLVAPYGSHAFPCDVPRGVKITGSWGFSSTTPKAVEQACLFQAAHERRTSFAPMGNFEPLGAVGGSEFAQQTRLTSLHPVTRRLLETYRRIAVA